MKKSALNNEFVELVTKYLDLTANAEERDVVEKYFTLFSDAPEILERLKDAEVQQVRSRLRSGIEERIRKTEAKTFRLNTKHILRAAAVLIVVLFSGIYFQAYISSFFGNENNKKQQVVAAHDLKPGGNQAILVLSDGTKVSLNDAEGRIAGQRELTINKKSLGQLVYEKGNVSDQSKFNTIKTPVGGQYQVILPDGTRVWLNAASSLHYPLAFGDKSRIVELIGEAYFEVAKDQARPFKVRTALQEVKVLGTHFNVNAYPDDKETKTTLLEGSVTVGSRKSGSYKIMQPGQQSQLDNSKDQIQISNVDTDQAISWKLGYFMFYNQSLENIMKELSRWYDIENIEYQSSGLSKKLFSGTISKYSNASQVLKKLELTEAVHFKIKGRSIIVMK